MGNHFILCHSEEVSKRSAVKNLLLGIVIARSAAMRQSEQAL